MNDRYTDPDFHLVPLSAKNREELNQSVQRLSAHLQLEPMQALPDLAYTYQTGKRPFAHRLAFVMTQRETLKKACDKLLAQGQALCDPAICAGTATTQSAPRVAFLFPGYGSQYSDTVRALYESSSSVRQTLKQCAAILDSQLPRPFFDYLFSPRDRREPQRMPLAQWALFAVEYAVAQLWLSLGIQPAAMIGQGLGEYVVACLNGTLSLRDALLTEGMERCNCWSRHLFNPAHFLQELEQAQKTDITLFLEVGPHAVLQSLTKKAPSSKYSIISSLDRRKPGWQTMLSAVGSLWCEGVDVRWQALHTDHLRRRVHVPAYPFARTVYTAYQPEKAELPGRPAETTGPSSASSQEKKNVFETLASLLQELFGMSSVSPEKNFFALGGDSLGAIRLRSCIERVFAVDLPLEALFASQSIAEIAQAIEARQYAEGPGPAPIPPQATIRDTHVLSHTQSRMLFLAEKNRDCPMYNLPTAMILHGELNMLLFQKALQAVIDRHDQLRATFFIEEHRLVQTIHQQMHFSCSAADWTTLPQTLQQQKAEKLLAAEAEYIFDLRTGPLIRVHVVKLAANKHLVLINTHHIIFDAWSMNVLLRDINEIYAAFVEERSARLPALSIQYTDYVDWVNTQLEIGLLAASRECWHQQLGGTLPLLDLPLDYTRPTVQQYSGSTCRQILPRHLVQALREVAKQYTTTLYTLLLAAFQVLLHRYSGQEDIIVGTSVAGRTEQGTEDVIGMFVNTLAMRADLSGKPRFCDMLMRVRQMSLTAFSHQNYPFDMLIDELKIERDESRSPIFSAFFNFLTDKGEEAARCCGCAIEPIPAPATFSKFDLSLLVSESPDDIQVDFEYCAALFQSTTIARMLENFCRLLTSITTTPQARIGDLDLLSPEETHQLLRVFNETAVPFPEDQTLHQLLSRQAAICGEQIAVRYEDQVLTYRELEEQSNRLAHYLQSLGVVTEMPVALLYKRSLLLVIAILAILKAGGAYVPIDPSYPERRIASLLQASGALLVIVQQSLLDLLDAFAGQVLVIEQSAAELARQSTEPPEKSSLPEHLAYILFTSGSTGLPKGVQVPHRGLVNYLCWAVEAYAARLYGTFPLYTSCSFDLTVTSLFVPLLSGKTILMQPAELEGTDLLITLARCHDFQSAKFTPAHLELLVQDASLNGAGMKALRQVIVGGEALSPELVKSWFTFYPHTTLYNEYGPTETVVGCVMYSMTAADTFFPLATVPIGRPIANTKIALLDAQKQLVPVGARGEIYIAGAGVARGYLNDPVQTAERFIEHELFPGEVLYRTGDIARYQQDGTLQYLGREDQQVKIRGFRIEIGEIEAALLKHSAIRECVVLANADKSGRQRLVAYLVTKASVSQGEVSVYLGQYLPSYMVPDRVVVIESIPLTVNGKVDRSQLPDPDVLGTQQADQGGLPPDELQAWLMAQWQEVLGIDHVGLQDDFFAIGGHSLKILPLIVRMKPKYPAIQIQDIFTYRTIAALSDYLTRKGERLADKVRTSDEKLVESTTSATHSASRPESFTHAHMGTVLLTGATGFLGSHLLYELLEQTDCHVICLLRSSPTRSALERLHDLLSFYFGEALSDYLAGRVTVIEGDLARTDLGLHSEDTVRIEAHVDTIIHCAADVRHYGDQASFENTNVAGTQSLLALARRGCHKRFHYISTASIVGWSEDDPAEYIFSERDFDRGQVLNNVYTKSKFQAEKIVREAIADGLAAAIYRVGNLVGHASTGQFQRNIETNAFYRMLKALMLLGASVDVPGDIDLTPIDYCCQALVRLATVNESTGRTFHLCNPVQISMRQLTQQLQAFGYSIAMLQPEQFNRFLFRPDMSDEHQEALQLIVAQLEGGSERRSVVRVDCQETISWLEQMGVVCPEPGRDLLYALLKYAIRCRFFPMPTLWDWLVEQQGVAP